LPPTPGANNNIAARFNNPWSMAFAPNGDMLVADSGLHAIRLVPAGGGPVSTIAGTPGTSGSEGDGGPASASLLNTPLGVAVDATGRNIYIADTGNGVIRQITAGSGFIYAVVGNYSTGASTAQTASPAFVPTSLLGYTSNVNGPTMMVVNPKTGILYFSDTNNGRVRSLDPTTLNITVIGGGGNCPAVALPQCFAAGANTVTANPNLPGFVVSALTLPATLIGAGGLPAIRGDFYDNSLGYQGRLSYPVGLALDASGNLYVADAGNSLIRFLKAPTQ